jgi:hypothetical protein
MSVRLRSLRPTPATLLAGTALFFALGGTAVAVSHAVRPQARCSYGAVRAVAVVTGEPGKGTANLPDQFSSAKSLFLKQFNCAGGATSVRRIGQGQYEVQFAGNPSVAAVSSASGAQSWLSVIGAGTFRIGENVPGRDDPAEAPFVVVAF